TLAATETLGWTFTGLVVPGYLAMVALLSWPAALLMIVESLCTVAVVRLLGDGLARLGAGSRFFGRERFFLILVAATGLRLVVEHSVLTALSAASWLASAATTCPHSLGLVLVPLMAHTLDRVGVVRGLAQQGMLTALTAVIIALLVRASGTSLTAFSTVFDDIALSVEQNPKAYVLLLAGALLAARANVSFGWDFHGIVVPGLLAVAWLEPTKVLFTLAEALAALGTARLVLLLPLLRTVQIEGPRRLVFVFCVDALLRVAASLVAPHTTFAVAGASLYGFGYLLPALVAVAMWRRHSIWRVLLPAAQVSFGAFLAGSLVFFVLTGLGRFFENPGSGLVAPTTTPVPGSFERAVLLARPYAVRNGSTGLLPTSSQAARWRAAVEMIAEHQPPSRAIAPLLQLGMQAEPIIDDGGGVFVHPPDDQLGRSPNPVLIVRSSGRRIAVAIPTPANGDLVAAAADVALALDARVVVAASSFDGDEPASPAAVLLGQPYSTAAKTLAKAGWSWLELLVDAAAPDEGALRARDGQWRTATEPQLLASLLPELTIAWDRAVYDLALAAPGETWNRIASAPCGAGWQNRRSVTGPLTATTIRRIVMDLESTSTFAHEGHGRLPMSKAEQWLYAEEILRPLVSSARHRHPEPRRPSTDRSCRAAAALGLAQVTIEAPDNHRSTFSLVASVAHLAPTVILRHDPSAPRPAPLSRPGRQETSGGADPHRGALGDADPRFDYLVSAPHPAREPYTAAAAIALCRAAEARACLVCAGWPNTNAATATLLRMGGDNTGPRCAGCAAVSRSDAAESPPDAAGLEIASCRAFGEVLARGLSSRPVLLEVRGAGEGSAPLGDGAVIAWGSVPGTPPAVPSWLSPLEEAARRIGFSTRRYDGSQELACCGQLHDLWRHRFLPADRDRVAVLFVSATARERRFGAANLAAAIAML
ncbi:MAG: poly-gamma-glutamate biosynthesis protein PgsC/CapC, partial [Pseudomonadota bacterium]